jgi:WD40 repeat protein
MADLQELFARLNGQGAASAGSGYQHPAVSSPIFSPSPNSPQPHHQSAVLSPAGTPAPELPAALSQTPQQQSAQLLNLLRFNQQPGGTSRRPSQNTQASEGRSMSNSGLVASYISKASPQAPLHSSASNTPAPAARHEPATKSGENPQDLLMRLLNQAKPPQSSPSVTTRMPETAVDDVTQNLADATLEQVPSEPAAKGTASPMRIFGADGAGQSSPFEVKAVPLVLNATPNPKPPAFTYVNPFDKLEAASPRTRTPVAQSSRALAPKMEILKPKHGLDGAFNDSLDGKNNHTHKARKLSPGASTRPHETVAEAVSDLGEQIGQQVDEALAEAESQSQAQEILDSLPAEEVQEMEQAVQDTASDIKKELEDDSNVKALEETLPKPMVKALKDVVDEIVHADVADVADVADNWESADAEEGTAKDETVIVYRFPMRAFSSIAVKDMPERRTTFLPDLFMDIVRLKKDFDQIDRSLVSASKNFIVYALVKKGGFRIIRQENGRYRHVFENHQERIFNIALCTTGDEATEPLESILGIGVNGTVFWTSLEPNREDQFGEDLDTRGLLLPPSPSQDDNTSGGQLKTRAKPSSRHPEFFAVGRGKSIHIVWPRVAAEYLRGDTRICHTEKYLKERSLKILTGKAGKDFTFSEDDTVIVSLDKAGRMRFWDIRSLTEKDLGVPRGPPRCVEVSDTLLEFHTTSPTAKSWPTSVFFFDKDKPFNKGIALRYVMVGMKQNHAFQLWDLGLGKAVQEIILPHEKESDAICSVAFHPKTGIMAVAHPTRNSIFFVHVSCPRYNLPVMSQAAYITRLNSKDRSQPPLPSVNATAIMTSISEYSFATKGQIRSLHMLNDPAGPPDVDDPENTALFELYVMHSKGVCTLRIRRSDLGWKKEGEPLNPREAEQEGVITLSQLKAPQPISDELSTGGDTSVPPKPASDRSTRESIKKESSNVSRQSMTPEAAMRASTLAKVESKQDAARAAIINGGEKSEKKKKKRSTAESASQASTSTRAPPPSYAQAAQAAPRAKSPSQPDTTTTETSVKSTDSDAPEWAKKLISQHFQLVSPAASAAIDPKKLQEIVQAEITNGFARELDVMYKRFDEDKRVLNAANGAKQEAILRVVSSTLTENVEGVMLKMINESVREIVLPQVLAATTSTIEKSVSSNLKTALPAHLAKEIPDSVSRALRSPQMLQSLSEPISKKIKEGLTASLPTSIQPMVQASVGTVVTPAFTTLSNLVKTQVGDQLREANEQRLADSARISKLTETVGLLTETIQTMAASQAELQEGFLKLQQLLSPQSQVSMAERSPQATRSPEKLPEKSPEQLEAESITRLMSEGNYEQGTMQWLQSNRTSELFDTVFVRCNPAYLNRVSPLLALSTGAVVTEALEHNLTERLIWLDAVLKNVDPNVSPSFRDPSLHTDRYQDNEIHDIVPKIMDVMNQRLTATYIKLNENSPGNQLLRRISSLVSKVNELARAVTSHA